MRKISEMYRRSGGSAYRHTCGECKNLRREKRGSRVVYKCELYQYQMDRRTSDWKPSYVACKFFGLPWNEAYPGEVKGQMSIEDYPEWMP